MLLYLHLARPAAAEHVRRVQHDAELLPDLVVVVVVPVDVLRVPARVEDLEKRRREGGASASSPTARDASEGHLELGADEVGAQLA